MIKILLIEDDEACAYTLQGGLELLDVYEVSVARNGREGLEMFNQLLPDVVVTDIEMPVMDGYELVEKIRSINTSVVIIMESGKTMPKDVLKGYKIGVDDYIKKPFVAEELHAHIQAILKRLGSFSSTNTPDTADYFHIGHTTFDVQRASLQLNQHKQELTAREAGILKVLYDKRNTVVSREEILTSFWGSTDYFHSRSLDVFICKLRKYFAQDPSVKIGAVKGKGIKMTL